MKKMVYLADDHKDIRELLTVYLEKDGYSVKAFENGDKLLLAFRLEPCDLVILDIMMPGNDGIFICQQIRKLSAIPIIILTAKESEMDYIYGIESGGDDYLIKPFKPRILLMRVKSLLRRVSMAERTLADATYLTYGDITLDQRSRQIHIRKSNMDVTLTEYELLKYFISNKEKAISREELLDKIWGYEAVVETRVTDEAIRRLRKKINRLTDCTQIETVWGIGYRLTHQEAKENNEYQT